MWLLTILLFVLTCVYTRIQYNKIVGYYDDLKYDIVELQMKNDEKKDDNADK